jgi:LmbE family N-acetylglucosaminyl deacetylase
MTTLSLGWSLLMAGIPSGPLLLVSPHLDDVALSCAAVLERGEAVDVVTVCAGAPDPPRQGWWDAECGFSSSAESIPTRLREDDAAFLGTPHRRRHLSLLEVQYVEDGRTPDEKETIAAEVGSWMADNPAGTVALPAGAGCRLPELIRRVRRVFGRPCHPPQHPDHLFVRDAALPVLGGSLLLYEELPYLWGGGADDEARRIAAAAGWESEPLVVPVDRDAKAARIRAYSSQIGPLSPAEGRLDEPARLPLEERYWLLRRSRTSA